MHDSPSDHATQKEGEVLPSAGERERVLAAVGWEGEPRRRKVLRRLLREQCQRIYLYCYAATHNRSSAMDGTRRALLRTARNLEQIPETCSLSTWVFLEMQPSPRRVPECPEPWRVLADLDHASPGEGSAPGVRAAPAPPATKERAEAAADSGRHREVHPGCGDLQDAYRTFRDAPGDEDLMARAGWSGAIPDLDLFLDAQFGDDHPQAVRPVDYWRQVLRSFRWSGSGMAAASVVIVVLALAVLLGTQWQSRSPHGGSEHTATDHPAAAVPAPPPGGPELSPISGAGVQLEKAALLFHWSKESGIQQYRLSIMTAKLEPLFVADRLADPAARVTLREVSGLHPGDSYLFRVDGMKNGRTVASSGYQPFDLP